MGSLQQNLRSCWYLFAAVVMVQVGDALVTQIAISRRGNFEANVVLRPLMDRSLAAVIAVKLTAVLAVVTLALARLPLGHARLAVGFALVLSLMGPLAGLLMIIASR
jgi:hypothetical protein